ncbi:MAG: NfeD family protein [Hyphomicrobiales bacterium]|nr:MAG: NfeD family protein [Hyphomicrobiales bacterium]
MQLHERPTPGIIAWLIALISLILPWAGIALIALGAWRMSTIGKGEAWLAGLGVLLIGLDILIDFVWAHPALSPSDEPELNRRGAQLKGRTLELSSPIEGGRGLVRCDDTVWQVEGPDLPAGCRVKVVGVTDMLLRVEPL